MVHINQFIFQSENLFRTSFQFKNRSVLHWFPGHMGKGVKDMQKKLKSVDCIIEVHDARIPLTGRNPDSFQTVTGLRPHILVFNKRDLADENLEESIKNKHKTKGFDNIVFTNCKDPKCRGIKSIVPLATKLITSNHRFNRSENVDSCLMVIGVPNVGKSSLINSLRNRFLMRGGAAQVGAIPGITRAVGSKIKISDDPLMYVLDTPGVLSPKVPTVDDGMKLALCATIPDKEVGVDIIADYLLFWMNKHKNFSYLDYFGIDNPNDNILEVLGLYAINNNLTVKSKDLNGTWILRPDTHEAAYKFVDSFRKGLFGRISLDADKLFLNVPEKQTFIVGKRNRAK